MDGWMSGKSSEEWQTPGAFLMWRSTLKTEDSTLTEALQYLVRSGAAEL